MRLELTGGLFAVLVIALGLLLPVATVLLWRDGEEGPAVVRAALRWFMVVLSQLTAVLAVLVLINNQFSLYSSWDDLFGRTTSASSSTVLDPSMSKDPRASGATSSPGGAILAVAPWVDGLPPGFTALDGRDTYLAMVKVPGSTAALRLYVAIPPQYSLPQFAKTRFPVVELFHGYPGTATTWFHAMDVRARLAEAQAAGAHPFVLVVPQISVAGAPDLECTDLPGQPQIATFLTTEVQSIITSRFRVRTDAAGWGDMGYSEGGYCAAQLTMRHPELFAAGVDISGYDKPLSSYFDAYPALRAAGRLSVLLSKAPAVALLASASTQDSQSSGGLSALGRGSRPPTTVTIRLHPQGGHNTSDWSAELASDFVWLSAHVGGPVG